MEYQALVMTSINCKQQWTGFDWSLSSGVTKQGDEKQPRCGLCTLATLPPPTRDPSQWNTNSPMNGKTNV